MSDCKPLSLIERAFDRAAVTYDEVALMQQMVADHLFERIACLQSFQAKTILDLGCGTGYSSLAFAKDYPSSDLVSLDLSKNMLSVLRGKTVSSQQLRSAIQADMHGLPLMDNSVDLVFSSLAFQWSSNWDALFAEIKRVLRPNGLLFFSTFGPDALKELKSTWLKLGLPSPVNDFHDMHDWGDALQRAGFSDPVMDRQYLTLRYPDLLALLRDIRSWGANVVINGKTQGMTSDLLKQACRLYEKDYSIDANKIPASFEIIYGHAIFLEKKRKPSEEWIEVAFPFT